MKVEDGADRRMCWDEDGGSLRMEWMEGCAGVKLKGG